MLSSLWKVADYPSQLLMERFYGNLVGTGSGEGMTKARALQEAKRWLREYEDEDGAFLFAHPIYWAGFVLTGMPD